MQQELIEMLEEIIPYVEVWHKEDQDVIDKAEALVEKAKNNAPAVQVYQLAKLGGPTETAWIDVTQEVYEDAGFYKDDFKRRILSATPATAPAQEIDKSVADAEIKAMYVESQGSDKGWLGIEGSYFIGGVVAARRQKKATKPAQYKDSTPQLSVGESSFESWFESYNPVNKGDKQRAREAYAAGMGDPLVTVTPELLEFAEEVRRTGDTRLASMAIALLNTLS